ncbi:unnamed protein product, partial [Symbiodinium sp. CCMP2592]
MEVLERWLSSKVEELRRCPDEDEKKTLRLRFTKFLDLADGKIEKQEPVSEKTGIVKASEWEVLRDGSRRAAASVGMPIRPRQFLDLPLENAVEIEDSVPDLMSQTSGYRLLLRTEEVWKLLALRTQYCNWYTRLSEGNTKDIATDWQIDFWIHLVRPQSYKGQKNLETSVRINFEGMTFLGFFFTAGSSLQGRSCKPELQKSTLRTLELFLETFVPGDITLQLLPQVAASAMAANRRDTGDREPRAMDPDPPVLGLVREVVQMQSISFTCPEAPSRQLGSIISVDGRTLQREAKPKSIFALQRFLAKPAGFMNRSDDNTLESLGLSEILVSHAHRLSCDVLFHFWNKSFDQLSRVVVEKQNCKSVLLMSDASPKGKLDDSRLDFLHGLVPHSLCRRPGRAGPLAKDVGTFAEHTVSDTVKMKEAQRVADNFAAQSVEPNPGRNKKLPKVLGLIRQRRLAAREEVQAVMHILSLAGLDFRLSERQLRPPDLRNGEIRLTDASLGPMLWHTESGAVQWDAVLPEDLQELRLVLAPDEGGPLWAGFQWLAKRGYRISFLPDLMHKLQNSYLRLLKCTPSVKRMYTLTSWLMRAKRATEDDSLMQLFGPSILKENGFPADLGSRESFEKVCEILGNATRSVASLFDRGRWISWGHAARKFKRSYSCTLLMVYWGQEGVNPFGGTDGAKQTGDSGEQYDKIVDLCIRALVDESSHDLYRSLEFHSRPWCDLGIQIESFDGKVARHVREALGSEAASYLDAPPDVELRDNGLVEVVSRRGYVKQRLLEDHLTATLACCFELESYARHLRMAPHACASLLASGTTGESLLPTQTNLLEAVKAEWSLVVRMEGKVATADLLHQLCPYVLHQCYRELMSSLAAADFCLTAECREMVSAWYPGLSQSSNVEDVFKSCEEACRRTKAGAASMPNLSIVAMRALMQKMTNGEGQARSVVLEGSDFEGPEVKALKSKLFSPESFTGGLLERKEMSLDDLLKDNTGTTAFNHNKLHLNNMQGLLLADKMGIDVEVAARSFWVPPLCQRGMLFSLEKGGKYFLSVGSTPAVCHASCLQDALPLQELDLQFCGELPPETLNEQEVPTSSREQQDPLQTNEFVRALKVEVNEKPLQLLLTKFWQAAWKKVRVFNYSVHLSPDGYLLRRCQNDLPLVAALMKSGGILSLTSDALSRVLDEAGSSLRKSATKTQKIRAVCSLAVVKQHVKQSRIDEILEHCQQLDDKRLQKIDAAAADAEDDEEEQPDDE